MNNPLLSPWIPALVLLALGLAAKLFQRNWFAPSVFAPMLWFAYIFIPITLAPEYEVSSLAVWLIVLLIGCFTIGAAFAETEAPAPTFSDPTWEHVAKRLLAASLVLSAVSMAGAAYSAMQGFRAYNLDASLSSFLAIGHLLAVERYAGEATPFLVRVLVMWTFPAALLAGMSFACETSRRRRLLCVLPFVPAVLFSLIQAAKANTLIAAVMAIAGYLAMRVVLARKGRDRRRAITIKILAIPALGVVAGLCFFFLVDTLRTHTQDQNELQVQSDIGRAQSTAIGYLAVFSNWVDRPEALASLNVTMGEYTFGGLLEAAGLSARSVGVYSENVSVGSDESNIYTAFRGLVEDFTLFGAAVLCILFGYRTGRSYSRVGQGSVFDVLMLVGFYGFLLWSPIGSIFVYNGPILGLIVAGVVFARAKRTRHCLLRARGRVA